MDDVTDESKAAGPAVSTIAAAIGTRIAQRRTLRGMSAAELARRAGLSKGTMSAIEAGTANPTISTLDAIAVALRIPMTDLLAHDTEPGPVHMPGTEIADGEEKRELLRRISGGHSLEIWRMRLPAHHASDGVPHAPGTIEHLYVAAGHLTAGPTDALVDLGPGDMLAYAGDVPHHYRTGDEPVDLTVTFATPVT
ncbi:helix-turn-helix domain-containing protein [Gordonia hydrophobica]|uniref:XRE family transcriptional regulator n=1 Tax=Gordonia hydrophobica TaxID=40516 RepID=A0ABZ2U5K9_9ACTN|nr:XRE family transcriptional regulator [Gordonia hydrophobica]MBM7369067.1 transcriptional regulator with XRE-family HTH domain [Gordonia hydrophobica]